MWYVYFLKLTNDDGSPLISAGYVDSTRAYRPVKLLSYVAVDTEATARTLEGYFKSGSGKAFANKRFW